MSANRDKRVPADSQFLEVGLNIHKRLSKALNYVAVRTGSDGLVSSNPPATSDDDFPLIDITNSRLPVGGFLMSCRLIAAVERTFHSAPFSQNAMSRTCSLTRKPFPGRLRSPVGAVVVMFM